MRAGERALAWLPGWRTRAGSGEPAPYRATGPLSEPREWVVRCEGKLWTHNSERRLHWSKRADLVRQWRSDFGWLVRQARIPHLECIAVEVRQECRTANLPDPAACAPVVKAAVDALVDLGVVDDDDGGHVVWIRFWPAVKTGRDALVVHVVEQPDETASESIGP